MFGKIAKPKGCVQRIRGEGRCSQAGTPKSNRLFIEAISKLGFSVKIKTRPRINPQTYLKYVEDLRRGLNADIGRKDFFEMASTRLL